MPNRILREGILTSERVNQLDWPAENFYRRLMSVVDDFGRFDGRASIILAACYPLKLGSVREADVQRWIAACVKAVLVRLYSSNGKQFLLLIDFNQHIRATKSKYPEPLDNTCSADAAQTQCNSTASAHEDGGEDEDVSEDVSEDGGEGEKSPPAPHEEFQNAWNTLGPPFAKIVKWSDARRKALNSQWSDTLFREQWQTALKRMSQSVFCRGTNDRGWIADVDFFLRPETIVKIIEGKYDNAGAKVSVRNIASSDEALDTWEKNGCKM